MGRVCVCVCLGRVCACVCPRTKKKIAERNSTRGDRFNRSRGESEKKTYILRNFVAPVEQQHDFCPQLHA